MQMMRPLKGLMLVGALTTAQIASAEPTFPAIQGYGGIHPTEGASERPDRRLRYRVVFNITKAAPEPGKVNPSLDKVARFLNLLAADGVRPRRGDVVAIVHGAATPLVMSNEAYRAKHGAPNPNLELIRRLREAGAEVHVCSQALFGNRIERTSVAELVEVDVAALVTIANLQLRGYALIPD
jgi:intracellular sulfur oxidation DsrE/DsrF family protein